jgi:oxepin-CoA hydrolase/3-oxo-5,6-dehydrosuberyl-CoA semialdehyde dehydrogenase
MDINNRKNLFASLSRLHADQQPSFGIMTPQHMVEHLIWTIAFSNGKLLMNCITDAEEKESLKKFFIDAAEYPMGIKSSVLDDNILPSLQFESLRDSILVLMNELNDFDIYFFENKNAMPVHTTMGELTHEEWVLFHNKHFAHHFKQFDLI